MHMFLHGFSILHFLPTLHHKIPKALNTQPSRLQNTDNARCYIMESTFDSKLKFVFAVMIVLMRPCSWLESLCFAVLGIDSATTFRVLPSKDAHPEFPMILSNGLALIHILPIPNLMWLENEPGTGMLVAKLLSPLTRRCSRRVRWLLMLPRVWLHLALFNYHMVSLLEDPKRVFGIALKLGFSMCIL